MKFFMKQKGFLEESPFSRDNSYRERGRGEASIRENFCDERLDIALSIGI